ncbi:hypothetical protein F4821DRAFT_249370 [Hypoxylon rubiginosum]|uniref:Uncharacterized protein n=1 Tax=Hypoxylon rubiginosum TaxID=110542 RepID=A0ACC0CLX6_9PEZI|nr:hypothetical protein F4821DRAFT_249370 [Hypoxylon rubiginosum]
MHFAILIGINFHPKKPLYGCVRDVKDLELHYHGLPIGVDLQVFTGTPSNDTQGNRIAEDPNHWPTFDNMTAAIEHIACLASEGDFVYVHFSGHGVRIPHCGISSTRTDFGFGLVLLEGPYASTTRYVRGVELALILKKLIEKGLIVTLVLDCCFSGDVSRNGGSECIRSIDYDPEIDAAYPISLDMTVDIGTDRPANRNGSMLQNWILNPEGYTILTACGPHEIAREIWIERLKHGALSYFLLRTLKKPGIDTRSHFDIYKQLVARFEESCPQQNPICYGNKDLLFFGPLLPGILALPDAVIIKKKLGMQIQAGQVHGFSQGDVFTAHPFHVAALQGSSKEESSCNVKITALGPFTSQVEVVSKGPTAPTISTGFRASPITTLSLRQYPIKLCPGLPHSEIWQSMASKRNSLDITYEDQSGRPFTLYVSTSSTGNYEMRDAANKKIMGLPKISIDEPHSIEKALRVIEHITRYNHILQLHNPSQSSYFTGALEVRLLRSSGETLGNGQMINVNENESIELQVKNMGKDVLYLYVYCLSPLWQVENILNGTYEAIPPCDSTQKFPGTTTQILQFEAPTEIKAPGMRSCKDTLKLIVTTQPTNLDLLEMPDIHRMARTSSIPAVSVEGSTSENPGPTEDWVAFTYQICTTFEAEIGT